MMFVIASAETLDCTRREIGFQPVVDGRNRSPATLRAAIPWR
jgi:hypothetical protein